MSRYFFFNAINYKMSLIITSSNEVGNTNQLQIDAPYNYRNDIKSGLRVPKGSEIAVESVKINRQPTIDYSAGACCNFFMGQRLDDSGSLSQSQSYIMPSVNTIDQSLSPKDFGDKFSQVMNDSFSIHPEIITTGSSKASMTVRQPANPAVNGFDGYKYLISQVGTTATSAVPPSGTEKLIHGSLTYDGATITSARDDTYLQLQPEDEKGGPISLFDGELVYTTITGTDWTLGLSRPILNSDSDTLSAQHNGDFAEENPWLNFEPTVGEGLGPAEDLYFDYAVESVSGEIRLYHAVPNADARSRESPIVMQEILYFNKNDGAVSINNSHNSSFASGTRIPSASITDITFKVSNEILEISASGNLICRANVVTSASFKDQIPKPVSQSCWKMYPTACLWESGDTCLVKTYQCRDNTTIKNNKIYNTWNFRCDNHANIETATQLIEYGGSIRDQGTAYGYGNPLKNAETWVLDVDRRLLNLRLADMFGDAVEPFPEGRGSTYLRPYKGLNASLMQDYEPLLICGPSDDYLPRRVQSWQPNTADQLGFSPFAIAPTISGMIAAGGQASFVSAAKPSTSSESSTFIRVPTLNHKTFNFGTGNPSKILYQVPRFDNSGTDAGALFFQNSDKTYIDLNNIDDIVLTDLDVQFVRKNETFAKDLTGSSEVVFHIRKKK